MLAYECKLSISINSHVNMEGLVNKCTYLVGGQE